jgi:hypothetical protein
VKEKELTGIEDGIGIFLIHCLSFFVVVLVLCFCFVLFGGGCHCLFWFVQTCASLRHDGKK